MSTIATNQGRVVHVSDKVEDAVYIGRAMPRQRLKASPFANPYKVQEHGREDAIDHYHWDILNGPLRPLLADLPALRGKPLACWCRRDGESATEANACHGDVLLSILADFDDDWLRALAVGEVPA